MRARQREFGLLVLRDREDRLMKTAHGVARLAAIVVRRSCKLPIMRVFVAIRAVRELNFVYRVSARRQMAFRALDLCVSAFQRILRSSMFFHPKK